MKLRLLILFTIFIAKAYSQDNYEIQVYGSETGFTDWFEVGFYLFNAIGNEKRTAFVGSHIRPRVSVPNHWRMASFFKMVK